MYTKKEMDAAFARSPAEWESKMREMYESGRVLGEAKRKAIEEKYNARLAHFKAKFSDRTTAEKELSTRVFGNLLRYAARYVEDEPEKLSDIVDALLSERFIYITPGVGHKTIDECVTWKAY